MKRKFIVLSNVVITFILGLFGVGCESEEPDTMYAYGTPPSYFFGSITFRMGNLIMSL